MAKSDPATETAKRIARTEAYAEKVRKEFASTVNEILALFKTMPTLDNGVMFSFDGVSQSKRKKAEDLFRQLSSAATLAIRQGITLEWDQANEDCDKVISSSYGRKILSNPDFAAWTDRNSKAMDAFINRTVSGMGLSDRIWKSVEQLREEMEVALTVSIGEGESAASMSRKVRQYLNDPDLMFRRFRYKTGEDNEGNPVYGLKWKKRVKTDDGKYRFIDYDRDSYKVGKGMYKSAAKNAMRVARTETNMAYRQADHERWQGMDFVLGQRIQLSRSHPREDICDELAGDYPKEFKFTGWHPQCFCFCTPILASEDEVVDMMAAMTRGEEYSLDDRMVKDYPSSFTDWVKANADSIKAARTKGTEPYFLRDNKAVVDDILDKSGLTGVPNTLKELDEAIKRYKYTDHNLKADEKEINAFMKKLFDDNDLGLDIDHDVLESVFKRGFLNTFQTGTSNGYNGSTKTAGPIETNHGRLVMSHKMFMPSTHDKLSKMTYTGKQLEREEYEKYGHLLDRDKYESYRNNLTQYGDVQVRFKKDKVSCTWTFGDSLLATDHYLQPSLVTDPRVESFDLIGPSGERIKKETSHLWRWQREAHTCYIELQYHGQLTIDMVESMTFFRMPDCYISAELIDKLLGKGIELWYLHDGKAVRYTKP